ncbi:MAG TPA: tetratricopeptide repeat protein [Terriglobales bacterium]|nr:tetratricopeptide repeat protein [Terriglobales bacterium]
MKNRIAVIVLMALVVGLCVPSLFAQTTGSVKGVCRDDQGNPIVGAIVEWHNTDNGRKYTLKTNKKGEYFSLGIDPGKYDLTLSKDGKQLDQIRGISVGIDELDQDIDLKKEEVETAKQQGMTPEQMKQMQQQAEQANKEKDVVKQLNQRLSVANTAIQGGDYDTAITQLTEANQIDPSRDILWARLADAYLGSAAKQTDPAEKTRRYGEAVTDYQKALDLRQKATQANAKPDDPKIMAAYYNNLAQAEAKTGKTDDAVKAYDQAAQLNPAGAAQYYYNQGAVLTNAGRADDAIAAFDKSIAADPTKAEAYYQKGVNLIAKATVDSKTGKVMPAPGTQEALNKYLELQPNGPFAEGAKSMLESIGGTVETSYGAGKKKAPPKKQ